MTAPLVAKWAAGDHDISALISVAHSKVRSNFAESGPSRKDHLELERSD
jgi:hypothetical protein